MDTYIETADTIVSKYFKLYKEQYENVGVLLSGGIDSSLITSYVIEHYPDAALLSMGTSASKDLPFVKLISHHFQKDYEWIPLTEEAIRGALPNVKSILKSEGIEVSPMQCALAVGYFLIFKHAQAKGITAIVTGQGPDILFAGYHKYKNVSSLDVNLEIQKDLVLLEIDKKRDGAMARYFGITLLNPYLEQEFVEFALHLPGEYKIANGIEKIFMREWGKKRHLPTEIVVRPKKAFQYSTGLHNVVKKLV